MPIQEHPIHINPESELVLWRYMSLPKFESLLQENAIFFCRADKFSDPFECSIPRREAAYRSSEDHYRRTEATFGRSDSVFNEEAAKTQSLYIADTHKKVKNATTVNCWHINSHESEAMWKLYLKNNEGIAIKTTAEYLFAALKDVQQEIGISKVRYIDYDNGIWYHETEYPVAKHYNFLIPLIHKRLEFEHERELRLYHHDSKREKPDYWSTQKNVMGEFIALDIPTLIQSVVFHPTADVNVKERIIEISRAHGHEFKFEESKMSTDPIF